MSHWAQYDGEAGDRYIAGQARHFSHREDWARRFLGEHLGPLSGLRVLDIGCGAGADVAAYASRGASAIGLDGSSRMLRAASERAPSLVRGDLEHLPFRDATFEAVASRFGFHYAASLDRAVAEAHRVLVPGGRLALIVPHPDDPLVVRSLADGVLVGTATLYDGEASVTYPVHSLADYHEALRGRFDVARFEEHLQDDADNGLSALGILAIRQ